MAGLSPELWGAIVGGTFTFTVTVIGILIQGRQSMKVTKMNFDHEDRVSTETRRRKNLEELLVALKQWVEALTIEDMNYRKVMDGVLTYDQALDLTIQNGGSIRYDHNRIETLIALYFPRLEDTFRKVRAVQDQIMDVREDFRNRYAQGTTRSLDHSQEVRKLMSELNTVFKGLEIAAIKELTTQRVVGVVALDSSRLDRAQS